ncbi:hypothetical protein N7495_001610 [Penicillium taxi]|uniref:uncharacterized protein n=1 Tax=Penicillium taxi TaxID=168475 RepID=UPI0025453B6D|nr:uncharacterized protein N7495_001610 [Penicillium taxi]KAJ5908928.1 hypothetical protein N7495_001610 [Penicillium taxi]
MTSPSLDQDITPVPRSREENQERAFIAASRRKDRSLDARLESANRASLLHKKRTGKAFHITKDIVEKEAMYEEVDERYQEKRIRMLQAQNMQIEEQFHRHLLAAFAARANSTPSASSIANRRASGTPRMPVDSHSNSNKMSLDLTNLRSPFQQGMQSSTMASPITTGESYALSPATTFDSSPHSYVNCIEADTSSYGNNMMSSGSTQGQIPAYVTSQTPGSVWNQQQMGQPSWAAMQQHVPTPTQTPTESQAVHMWQQQMMQQAQMPTDTAAAIQMRQFRDRLASAPELPLQHIPTPMPTASISGPSSHYGHSRGLSQPSNHYPHLNLLTQPTNLGQMVNSSNGSGVGPFYAETHSSPSFCPTPNTPLSPRNIGIQGMPQPKEEAEGLMVSHEGLDPDFNEFSQFALGLDSSPQERDNYGFEEFVALDDFGTVSC